MAGAQAFVAALTDAGVPVTTVDGGTYSHAGINEAVGRPEEMVVTPSLLPFLTECFGE